MDNKEVIYIAGPEVFFEKGNEHLASMRKMSEARGHQVSLPNDTPLIMDNADIRLNADEIFANLEEIIYDTTMIISDLDAFRGSEPDSGTIYEIGMGYARDLISYGHTRDMRPLTWKDQKITFDGDKTFDEHENKHHYSFLPFSPLIMASTKIVEGTYSDVLNAYEADKYYGHRFGEKRKNTHDTISKSVFVALRNYYDADKVEEEIKKLSYLEAKGYKIIKPYFRDYDFNESINEWLDEIINENTTRIDKAEIFIGDLNDYRGYECSNDVAFLCGYAFQTHKELYGFMDNTAVMVEKIPNKYVNGKYKDEANRDVENFNYPINLMFASSMAIYEGGLENLGNIIGDENYEKRTINRRYSKS